MTKIITVCKCESCDKPVKLSVKVLGQLIGSLRKTKPTPEFMSRIAKERHAANRAKKI